MKLLLFGKHLLGLIGGAERSIIRYVRENRAFDLVYFSGFYDNNLFHLRDKSESKLILGFRKLPNYFPILEYFLFYYKVLKKFNQIEYDEFIVYGFYIPLGYRLKRRGKIVEVHLRSETDLGIFRNYAFGWKGALKSIVLFINFPLRSYYCFLLKRTFVKSDRIIVNSRFMQTQLFERYGVDSLVNYPIVSKIELGQKRNPKYIVMIGDEVIKGFNTFRNLSSLYPDQLFRAYSKNITKRFYLTNNLELYPWCKDISKIYFEAKIVLVPSIWLEAFGRVAREAYISGIPVLASEVGGLPEAVNYDKRVLVKNYKDPLEWAAALDDIL